MCGGTRRLALLAGRPGGLSPRVRGNPGRRVSQGTAVGSIPACAGEPEPGSIPGHAVAVYPRVCGGTRRLQTPPPRRKGLSPRVRGNRRGNGDGHETSGSIPACAGEPGSRLPGGNPPEVYPRVCGGTQQSPQPPGGGMGLSPRVRGNRSECPHCLGQPRSIPACAGEPRNSFFLPPAPPVYPRVCGGTGAYHAMREDGLGLSPRVRGNQGLA